MARQPIMAPIFAPLLQFLIACPADAAVLSFDAIEALIGVSLPIKYRVESNNWSHRQYVHVRLWRALGWQARLDRRHRRVIFRRLPVETQEG